MHPYARAGLSAVIGEAIHVDTRHAQPQRNPALTGQLGQTAHRYPSQDVGRTPLQRGP